MGRGLIRAALAAVALLGSSAAGAQTASFEKSFDSALGTQVRAPRTLEARYATPLEQRIAELARPDQGRIGVAAIELSTGREVAVLADQRFPMASTSKIAVAAAFLEGVQQGRWNLSSRYPLLIPQSSPRFSSAVAPVRSGPALPAAELIEQMITRSSNPATDALLAAVGGPAAVNAWVRRQGISEFSIDRDIATLVRDDGEFDPATYIDKRDSATPRAMVKLLQGVYQGRYLTPASRDVLLGAMTRTVTGKRRIRAYIPLDAKVLHKTGSLNNTSSDVGIIELADGRAIAVAIYVTGQGSRSAREAKIAAIARALYDGYSANTATTPRNLVRADYPGTARVQ